MTLYHLLFPQFCKYCCYGDGYQKASYCRIYPDSPLYPRQQPWYNYHILASWGTFLIYLSLQGVIIHYNALNILNHVAILVSSAVTMWSCSLSTVHGPEVLGFSGWWMIFIVHPDKFWNEKFEVPDSG